MCATSARGRWRATMGANVVIICENVAQYGNISLLKNAIEADEFCAVGIDFGVGWVQCMPCCFCAQIWLKMAAMASRFGMMLGVREFSEIRLRGRMRQLI